MSEVRNMAKCGRCGDVVESQHRHDFVRCSCGAIFVDGGRAYHRAGADSWEDFIPLYTAEQRAAAEVV